MQRAAVARDRETIFQRLGQPNPVQALHKFFSEPRRRMDSLLPANKGQGVSRPNSVMVAESLGRNSGDKILSSVSVWPWETSDGTLSGEFPASPAHSFAFISS